MIKVRKDNTMADDTQLERAFMILIMPALLAAVFKALKENVDNLSYTKLEI